MYHFESAHKVCDQFSKLINMLRKEERMEGIEKYPCLDDSDESKYMSDKEILDKYRFRKLLFDQMGKERIEEFNL